MPLVLKSQPGHPSPQPGPPRVGHYPWEEPVKLSGGVDFVNFFSSTMGARGAPSPQPGTPRVGHYPWEEPVKLSGGVDFVSASGTLEVWALGAPAPRQGTQGRTQIPGKSLSGGLCFQKLGF